MKTRYRQITPYQTKDGSQIRELLHPAHHNIKNQSLAEAIVAPGQRTRQHRHHRSEEIYHITAGEGVLQLGERHFPVRTGDSICIPPGTPHSIHNGGDTPLRILCCCAPPYADDDTELLD